MHTHPSWPFLFIGVVSSHCTGYLLVCIATFPAQASSADRRKTPRWVFGLSAILLVILTHFLDFDYLYRVALQFVPLV